MTALQAVGLSHSEIPASMVICTYAGLIAAYHVLRRLREPRHPPCALFYFRLHNRDPPSGACLRTGESRRSSYFQLSDMTALHSGPLSRRRAVMAPTTVGPEAVTPRVICSVLSTVLLVTTCQRSMRRTISSVSPRVENNGFEPLTPCLQSRCSSQLS